MSRAPGRRGAASARLRGGAAAAAALAPLPLLLLLAAAGGARGAAPWSGQQFNYQLGQTFLFPNHTIPGVKVYGIDLEETPAATVANMVTAGLLPVCYFSTQYESWRSDASLFRPQDIGLKLDNWTGENWVDIRSANVRSIMQSRIRRCRDNGFVAIDPDNTDGYTTNTGFPLTAANALDFLTFLSTEARAQGLAIGLKNTMGLLNASTVGLWDFSINEECYQWSECDTLKPFADAGKPIFNIEYMSLSNFKKKVCPNVGKFGTTSIRKTLALPFSPRDTCDGVAPTPSPSPAPKASPSPAPKASPSPAPKASPSPAPKPSPSPAPPPSPSPAPPPSPSPAPPPSPSPAPPPSPSPAPPPSPSPAPPATCPRQRLAVPSFFNPCSSSTCNWSRAAGPGRLLVLNPSDGPGPAVDQSYAAVAASARAAGATLLGYVFVNNGAKGVAVAKAEVDKYFSWYAVDGVLFDAAGSDCAQGLPYSQQLVSHVKGKSPSALAALGWGQPEGGECFLSSPNAPDMLVTFEGDYSTYVSSGGWAPPAWMANYSASRFWHIVYSVPSTTTALARTVNLARARRAAWVYATNDAPGNPYDQLPSATLWASEVGSVANNTAVC